MIKYFIFFLIYFFINTKVINSYENKILLKIDSEIITTIDVSNEINYLFALNEEIKKLDQNTLIKIAKNNLIRDKIKQTELLKKNIQLEIEDGYLEYLLKNTYLRIGLNNLDEFKKYLKNYNVKIDTIEKKLQIDANWKKFVYAKYKSQIKIDKDKILNEVRNKKSKIYKLSEIFFSLNDKENLEEKINLIKKSISKNGFKNTALIYSVSDSSSKGGDLGWVNSNAISSKILKQLSEINVNEYTKPIIVPSGFLILKIQDYKEEKEKYNIDEEVEKIINKKINDQLNTYSNLYLNKLKKDIKINGL